MNRDLSMLESHLDAAYQAIRVADFALLAELGQKTDATLARIGTPDDEGALHRIRQKAARNAACLQAAGRGLRAARRRLEEVTVARASLGTYDSAGRRCILPAEPRPVTHRA